MTDAGPTCDWQTGTVWSAGRHVCGKAARWQWTEPGTGRQRFACGIHARSVRSLWSASMQTNLRLIGSEGKAGQ